MIWAVYLICIDSVQEGRWDGGKDIVRRRWLILCREIGQRATE